MDELRRAKNAAFNWSDEELLTDMDDMSDVIYKDKYQKPKRKGGAGGPGLSASDYYAQLKQKVQRSYTHAR